MQLELFSSSEEPEQQAEHLPQLSQQQRAAAVATLARWMTRIVRPQQGVAPMSDNVLPAVSGPLLRGAPQAAVKQREDAAGTASQPPARSSTHE